MAHKRQSRPDSGLGIRVKVPKTVEGVPSSLGSGPASVSVGSADYSLDKPPGFHLSERVCKVVLQKSIPAQIHQLILFISNNSG